jgi:hypothetical protein
MCVQLENDGPVTIEIESNTVRENLKDSNEVP